MLRSLILMIEHTGNGGLSQYTYNLCKALTRAGQKICLWTARGYEIQDADKEFRAERIFNRYATNPFKLVKAAQELAKRPPDIIHFQGATRAEYHLFLLGLLRLFLKAPVVYTVHDAAHPVSRRPKRRALNLLYRCTDQLIVHAEHNKRLLITDYQVDPAKVEVVPHGNYLFYTELAPSLNREELKKHPGQKNILFFGIITPRKGLIHLIRAFQAVHAAIPDSKLLIVGHPYEDPSQYLREIERLHLTEAVYTRFSYVPLEEVPGYFRAADVVVLPYVEVFQSGVLQLAYAFGKPVVVTNCGGMPEVVEEGKSGFIVPAGDAASLGAAILALLKSPDLGQRMGQYAKKLAETTYSWDGIARRTLEVYEKNKGSLDFSYHTCV